MKIIHIVNFKWDCVSSKRRWLMYFLSWTAENWIFSKTKLFGWLHWTHSLYLENPSCLQTTLASRASQTSSHTVPQALPLHTSTRPALELVPPRSLTAPWVQPTCIVTFYITVYWSDNQYFLAMYTVRRMLAKYTKVVLFRYGTQGQICLVSAYLCLN